MQDDSSYQCTWKLLNEICYNLPHVWLCPSLHYLIINLARLVPLSKILVIHVFFFFLNDELTLVAVDRACSKDIFHVMEFVGKTKFINLFCLLVCCCFDHFSCTIDMTDRTLVTVESYGINGLHN